MLDGLYKLPIVTGIIPLAVGTGGTLLISTSVVDGRSNTSVVHQTQTWKDCQLLKADIERSERDVNPDKPIGRYKCINNYSGNR